MSNNINFKKFYEKYGNEWSKGERKDYEILASRWKANKIIYMLKKNKIKIKSIVDFGTGPANILKDISQKLKIKKSYGIDISSSMVKLAKKNFPKGNYFVMKNLSHFNKKVDAVLFIDVLEHVPEPDKLLNEARKISQFIIIKVPLEKTFIKKFIHLKKNKIHPEGHINFWSKRAFINFLKKSDFEILSCWQGNPKKSIQFYKKGSNKIGHRLYKNLVKIIFNLPIVYNKLFSSNLFVIVKNKMK